MVSLSKTSSCFEGNLEGNLVKLFPFQRMPGVFFGQKSKMFNSDLLVHVGILDESGRVHIHIDTTSTYG